MDVIYKDNKIYFKGVADFDLAQTLDCGQSFRWDKNEDGSFSGVAYSKFVTVSLEDNTFIIDGADECDQELWQEYFDLSLDYGMVKRKLSELHPILKEAAQYAPGIRILCQEPFEALITFIISQNNNISRIKGIVQRLCENFGEKIGDTSFAFPTPKCLASLTADDLAPIRAGFRHRYIIDAAKKVNSGEIDLEILRKLPYLDAQKELMKITGVGAKVADCTLLYGLHRLDGFPMDVWMKRAMAVLFEGLSPSDFGEYAGIAQQYIFHYSRMHPQLFDKNMEK